MDKPRKFVSTPCAAPHRLRISGARRIITVDPRRTKTAEFSDIHVPLAPGSDVAFLQLISHQLPGYRVVTNDMHRAYLEGAWRVPPGSIDPNPGL